MFQDENGNEYPSIGGTTASMYIVEDPGSSTRTTLQQVMSAYGGGFSSVRNIYQITKCMENGEQPSFCMHLLYNLPSLKLKNSYLKLGKLYY